MQITEKHLKNKRRIGTLKDKPVVELETTGGLFVIAVNRNGTPEILGSGPHPAVARLLARKKESGIVFRELNKTEQADPRSIASVAPKYEHLTAQLAKSERLIEALKPLVK